jgi:hypothetical protein
MQKISTIQVDDTMIFHIDNRNAEIIVPNTSTWRVMVPVENADFKHVLSPYGEKWDNIKKNVANFFSDVCERNMDIRMEFVRHDPPHYTMWHSIKNWIMGDKLSINQYIITYGKIIIDFTMADKEEQLMYSIENGLYSLITKKDHHGVWSIQFEFIKRNN